MGVPGDVESLEHQQQSAIDPLEDLVERRESRLLCKQGVEAPLQPRLGARGGMGFVCLEGCTDCPDWITHPGDVLAMVLVVHIVMRRSIPRAALLVAEIYLAFALLAPCRAGTSTPEI
jgi:hypothetical protein